MSSDINIQNRRARFEYEILETFVAGLQLLGTEIKSIRQGKAGLADSYCYFERGELFIKNMHIAEYNHGNIFNHEPLRERKLLMKRLELARLEKKLQDQGNTIVPLKLFINSNGYAKIEIALVRGKKLHDKRDSLKAKDAKREIDRAKAARY